MKRARSLLVFILAACRRPLSPYASILAFLAFCVGIQPSQAWVPYECPPEFFSMQQQLRQALSSATPGKLFRFPPIGVYITYIPFPFPQTDEQVLADFRFQFTQTISTTYRGLKLSPDDQALVDLFAHQSFTYTISRVEDWGGYDSGRCWRNTLSRFTFLILFHDKQTGKEVEAAVSETGLQYGSQIAQPSPLPNIAALIQAVRIEYGIEGAYDAQLVAINTYNTLPVEYCDWMTPCVAIKAGNSKVYVLRRPERDASLRAKPLAGDWYEISFSPKTYTQDEVDYEVHHLGLQVPLPPLISIGNHHWAAATRVTRKGP